MTYAVNDQPDGGHPLRPGASPQAIRAGLIEDDRTLFDAAFAGALQDAKESLDLNGLFETLEHWRCVAVLQRDRSEYRKVVRRTAHLRTGEESAEDEPLAVTRVRAGM